MINVIESLKNIRKRLEKPEAWTQRWSAKRYIDKGDDVVELGTCSPRDPSAVCWCITGALEVEPTDSHYDREQLREAMERGACLRPHEYLQDWNDVTGRTHAEVLRAIDNAIALEERRALGMQRRLETRDGGGPWN